MILHKRWRAASFVAAACVVLATAVGLQALPVGASGGDVLGGGAFGMEVPGQLAPTPSAVVSLYGGPESSTSLTLGLDNVFSGGPLSVLTQAINVGRPSEVGQSYAAAQGISFEGAAAGLSVAAVTSSCQSNRYGSTATGTISYLAVDGKLVPTPSSSNSFVTPSELGRLSKVVSIEVNVRSYTVTPYRTSITQDALDVRILSTGTVVRIAGVNCSATGPDIALPPTIAGISPSIGAPSGAPVLIAGTNLCDPISVQFGSLPAAQFSASPDCTVVRAMAPPGGGSVPVRVITAGGIVQAPENFTYADPGYWMVAGDGGVFSYGSARFFGSTGGLRLQQPIVAMAATPDRRGYWLFAADGGVFAFGDAAFFGSVPGVLGPGRSLNGPIVAAQATPDGRGYRLFAADGGVFAFGDAPFVGSLPGLGVNLAQPISSATAAPIGQGYWLVARDGGVFAFGDAPFEGALAGRPLPGPVMSITTTSADNGYWLATAAGSVTPFGAAGSFGQLFSAPGHPIVGMAANGASSGYWLFGSDGGVFSFGAVPFLGSLGNVRLNQPIVGGVGF